MSENDIKKGYWNTGELVTELRDTEDLTEELLESLMKLKTVSPVDSIPNEIGRILYDDFYCIDRFDGVLFLTRRGIMALRRRGLI